jgi:hypothetical protein
VLAHVHRKNPPSERHTIVAIGVRAAESFYELQEEFLAGVGDFGQVARD